MDAERQQPVPVTRQAFLAGIAGVAAGVGMPGLWTMGRTARETITPRGGVTVNLSHATGKTVQAHLYGYATGALLDDDSLLAANKAVTYQITMRPNIILVSFSWGKWM